MNERDGITCRFGEHMRYRLHDIHLPLGYKDEHLIKAAAGMLGCHTDNLTHLTIIRRSIDARKKPTFIFTLEFDLNNLETVKNSDLLSKIPDKDKTLLISSKKGHFTYRPVVIGAGPAGLMATLMLSRNGLKPLLFERGGNVTSRSKSVQQFWQDGTLDINNNVLFGEGGAGLYSDGKLTSRSKDRAAVQFFMETLVECGAPASIMYDAQPHVGSDRLKEVVPNLRKMIIDHGGEIQFNTLVDDIIIQNNRVSGIIAKEQHIPTKSIILATGHSARDVFRLLARLGVSLSPKPIAVGVRLEFPQSIVDNTQWGKYAGHMQLGAATFRLTRKAEASYRGCYSFCMCPGGMVIPCASENGMLTTNGMSLHARDLPLANAAFLVPVTPEDYQHFNMGNFPELAGFQFQQAIEQKAFTAGGGNYALPVSNLDAFLKKKNKINRTKQISFNHTRNVNLHTILPEFICNSLVYSIPKMLKAFQPVDFREITLYAAETRSSCPVRILRGEDGQSVNTMGLYPCGEGAGYSGGIVSSALDGIRMAVQLIRNTI